MSKLFGDRAFYRRTLALAVPVMIQNGITSFVSLLDNIMVGNVGTESMAGVSIANTLMFVYNLSIFGAVSGAGIFAAQYFGKGDNDGVRYAFRFKLIASTIICAAVTGLFLLCGNSLIMSYIAEDLSELDPALVLSEGMKYLMAILPGLLPFAIVQSYASTLRETGESKLPMRASIIAVLINLVLNYVLIFGKLGEPRLGVVGAAIATDIARFAELAIVLAVAYRKSNMFLFLKGALKSLYIPRDIVLSIVKKGAPLFANELLWSAGMAAIRQIYASRGVTVVAALNISTTASDLFSVVFISMGTAIAIIVGQLLGANKIEQAKDASVKLRVFSVLLSVGMALCLVAVSPLVPAIYGQTGEVRSLAIRLICAGACFMPFHSYMNATYFTIRSGGKTFITFLFDSGFVWAIMLPFSWVMGHYTILTILPLYIVCQASELLKCVVGFILVRKGSWAKNFVQNEELTESEQAA